jgi:hypothetical protein
MFTAAPYRDALMLVFLATCSAAVLAQQRAWTDRAGTFSNNAELVDVQNGRVTLRSEAGKTIVVPLERLSERDRNYVSERRAMTEITELGGRIGVAKNSPESPVITVHLRGVDITDSDIAPIKDLRNLEWLLLSDTRVTDVGLQHLSDLQNLIVLDLSGCQVTDSGLKHLRGLKSLGSLILNRTLVTDEGIEYLHPIPNLVYLELNGTRVTDMGIDSLKDLQQLTKLSLSNTDVGDYGLKPLSKMPHLSALYLSNTRVTNEGVEHLCNIRKLNDLKLINTHVTEAGLSPLRERPGYRRILLITKPESSDEKVWLKQLANLRIKSIPLANNDAVEKEFVLSLLLKARDIEPDNPMWAEKLGDWFSTEARPFMLLRETTPNEAWRTSAITAVNYFEESITRTADNYGRTKTLLKLTRLCFAVGESEKAARYASELLKMSANGPSGMHGEFIHHGNLVLGKLALQAGDVEEAKRRLLAAGKTSGSPALRSFGPNMALAEKLLEKGERDVVLEYFELCKKFWSGENNHRKLERWADEVRNGDIPVFGANLVY